MYDDQHGFDTRFEWGIEGVQRLGPHSDVMVIVDVLSFSTAVDVAVGRGARVLPYRWRDQSALDYARGAGALLASGKRDPSPDEPYTLSPSSLLTIPYGTLLVLPSPNGSTLAQQAAELGPVVLTGCLRNAGAVAAAAREAGEVITVIAAGERWQESESLRPSFEDLVGAGAILSALAAKAPSPEAMAASAAYSAVAANLPALLLDCASGRELVERGFGNDVLLAAEQDVSRSAPVLRDRTFVDWGR